MQWKDFETLCLSYLQNTYSTTGTIFTLLGASDSTNSDIVAVTKNDSFFIEVKMNNSQAGQFVVFSESGKFLPSLANKNPDNPYTPTIINYMNTHYHDFANPSTNGSSIELPQDTLLGWVVKHYEAKGARFIITRNNSEGFIIFPIESIGSYFRASATYRVKRSGSSLPSPNNYSEIASLINDPSAKYFRQQGKKLIVRAAKYSDKQKLVGTNYSYQLNNVRQNLFEIRRLSNTANANVIFTLQLTGEQLPSDLVSFEQSISALDS